MAQIRTTLIEFGLLAVTITSAPVAAAEMSFRTATHGGTSGESWIVAEGDIVHATPDRFRRFLTAADIPRGARYEVYLHSPGGNLMAGIELGTIIRDYGFGTRVARSVPFSYSTPEFRFEGEEDGHCFSACAFAFLGGRWRIASDRSLGVHQHYTKDALVDASAKKFTAIDLAAQQQIAGVLAEYIAMMGVDGRFLSRAASAGPTDIYRFSTTEMAAYAITWDDQAYGEWRIEPYEGGVIAVTDRRDMSDSVVLFCNDPGSLKLLLVTRLRFPNKTGKLASSEYLIPGDGISVFDAEVPRKDVSGRVTSDRWEFELKLPREIAPEQGGGISAGGPMRFLFYHDIPSARFREMANVVGRNCISTTPSL